MKIKIIPTLSIVLMMLLSLAVHARGLPDIRISLTDYYPKPVQPGQVMDLYLQAANDGDASKNTSVWLVEEYPFAIENSQDVERAKNLGSVTTPQNLQFRLKIAEDAKDGIVPLRVRHKTETTDSGYIETTFDINIQTFNARLDVAKVEQKPQEIIPGEKGKLILTIRNYDDQPLKNVDIILDLTNSYTINANMDDLLSMQTMVNAAGDPKLNQNGQSSKTETKFSAIAPVGISNRKRLPIIAPDDGVQVEFDIMPLPDIQPNIYAVPVYLEYNDEDNNPFHLKLDIPVKINMESELFVELTNTTLRTTDFSGKLEFTVANRGLSDLRYVTLELKEHETIEMLTAPQKIYLGNFAPGESKKGTFEILAKDENITLPLIVDYRDSFNKEQQMVKFIPFHIINRNYYRDMPYEMWLSWVILGLVVISLTIFYVKNMSRD